MVMTSSGLYSEPVKPNVTQPSVEATIEPVVIPSGPAVIVKDGKVASDGGSTKYYELPPDAKELNDLIEYKNMSFALANIFKACYRFDEKDGVDKMYDLNKIIYFAERLKGMVEKKQI